MTEDDIKCPKCGFQFWFRYLDYNPKNKDDEFGGQYTRKPKTDKEREQSEWYIEVDCPYWGLLAEESIEDFDCEECKKIIRRICPNI